MPEEGEKGVKIDQGLEKIKQFMSPNEVWITNAVDAEAVTSRQTTLREGEETAQDLASRLAGYADKGGKWQSVRVVDHAFDVNGKPVRNNGKPVRNMVALVGTPKEG